ncbi:MAG: cytochrome c biogenesis protein DipZ, partial [Spirochaetales bacterium]
RSDRCGWSDDCRLEWWRGGRHPGEPHQVIIILLFAFVSGVITILSPCILPVLPIVLSGAVGGGKARPFGVVTGFVVTFTVFTLALSALVQVAGISPDALRVVAVGILAVFGLVMVVPTLRDGFEVITSRLAGAVTSRSGGSKPATRTSGMSGFTSGLPVGFSLGIVWTPCVGPIMASVISLAVSQQIDGGAVLITLAYTLGTSIPMLAVMVGGRALLNRRPGLAKRAAGFQRVFGVLMILVAVAIGFGWDRQFQSTVLTVFPNYGAGLTAIEDSAAVRNALNNRNATQATEGGISVDNPPRNGRLRDFGPAPELVAEGPWLNTGGQEFSMEDLRGKVVLIDFWTYSCVNCVRTLPYLRAWHETYSDQGLVIVGVHTPEFSFERSVANVSKAIADLDVRWPVVLDNSYAQWRAYNNRYWPAHFFIDAQGTVRYYSFGEGHYDDAERVIRDLLKEAGVNAGRRRAEVPVQRYEARTPETYLGYGRTTGFISTKSGIRDAPAAYAVIRPPENGEWSLDGRWTVAREYVAAESAGVLEFGFDAREVYLVIEPDGTPGGIRVTVDGAVPADTEDVRGGVLTPGESRLYHLVGLETAGPHTLRLDVQGSYKLFAFTFG